MDRSREKAAANDDGAMVLDPNILVGVGTMGCKILIPRRARVALCNVNILVSSYIS